MNERERQGSGAEGSADQPGAGPEEGRGPGTSGTLGRSGKLFFNQIRRFLHETLNLTDDANIEGTIETIKKDMVFRGATVWVLVCSIFIASIGLNINSAAVVIGAMLISPLMGPILAIGLAVGTNDLDLLWRALKNFSVMIVLALLTSTLYFLITPLADEQPELLARTQPTLLDALIAIFGGLAGIIGVSRRERGNVIPGVAIATALMPPLCTAGFGLANGRWAFFLGAIYLFSLNSIFIAISTVGIIRYLHFPYVSFASVRQRRRVRLALTVFILLVVAPSGWVLYGVVRESIWQRRARDFVTANLAIPGVDVINTRFEYTDTLSRIEVFLTGDSIPGRLQQLLESRMAAAGLQFTALRIHQPRDVAAELGRMTSELRVGIVEDLYERNAALLAQREERIRELETFMERVARDTIPLVQLEREVAVQYPDVQDLAFARMVRVRGDAIDTIPTFLLTWDPTLRTAQVDQNEARLRAWLRVRLGLDTLNVIRN